MLPKWNIVQNVSCNVTIMLLLKMWPKRSRSNCCPKWHSLKRCPKCQYLNCPPKWCCSQRFKNAFARNLSWNIAQNYITQNVTQNVVVENRIAKNVAQNVSQNVIIQMSLLKMPLFEMSPKSLIFGCEKKVEHFGIRNVPYLTLILFFYCLLISDLFRRHVFIDEVHVGVVAAATWPLERGFDNRRCHHKILTIPRRQGSMLWNSFYCSRCHTCLLKLDTFWCIIWGT